MPETLRVALKGKFYDIDPNELSPPARLAFEAKIKSGEAQIHAPEPRIAAPKITPEYFGGVAPGRDRTPEEVTADRQNAMNRLRTFAGNVPGAVVAGARGGLPGIAASVGLNAGAAALMPQSMLDKTNGDSAASLVGGLVSGGMANRFPNMRPALRGAMTGGASALSGELARQAITGEPGLDMQRLLINGTAGAAIGGGLTGMTEGFRKGTKSGVSEEMLTMMRGGGEALPQNIKANPAHANAARRGLEALDTRIPPAQVAAREAALQARRDGNEAALSRLQPANLAKVLVPPRTLKQPAPMAALDAKIKGALTDGDRAYWINRKTADVVAQQEYDALRKQYQTQVGAAVAPGAGKVPDFTPKNKGLFENIDKSTQKQLAAVDDMADKMRADIAALKAHPLSKVDAQLGEKLRARDVEFMTLAQKRQEILTNQQQQLTAILQDDTARLNAVKQYGYDKVQYDADLNDLRQKVTASENAIPVSVRAAMDASKGKGNDSLLAWSRGAQAPQLQEVADYLKKNGQWENTKLAMMNDFFEMARDPFTKTFSANGMNAAMGAYGSPEKLRVIFGTPQAAEKFRVLADGVKRLSAAPSGLGKLAELGATKSAIALVGGLMIYGANMNVSPGVLASTGGTFLAVTLPKLMNKAMESPAVYHAFKDVVENAAKGIVSPATRALVNHTKDIGFAITPQEAQQLADKKNAEREEAVRAVLQATQEQGQQEQAVPPQQ